MLVYQRVGSPHVYVWIVKAHGFVEFFPTFTINQAKRFLSF